MNRLDFEAEDCCLMVQCAELQEELRLGEEQKKAERFDRICSVFIAACLLGVVAAYGLYIFGVMHK